MLLEVIEAYLDYFPDERVALQRIVDQVIAGEALNDRRNFNGHITASGIVISLDKRQVLLIHHKQFQVWQQPGGHWEAADPNPQTAAKREVVEETGIRITTLLDLDPSRPLVPLDINSHQVTARPEKLEPPHFHHDFRYVMLAADTTLHHQAAEVNGARWFDITDPVMERIASSIAKLYHFKFV